MDSLDALMASLSRRHGNDPAFFAAIRPVARRILDSATPADARPALLAQLAEACELDRRVKDDCAAARRNWRARAVRLEQMFRAAVPPA